MNITSKTVERLDIKDPAGEGLMETFLIVYRATDIVEGDDIGYRVWLQPGEVHPQEVMFATIDTVSRVMAVQEDLPLVSALGAKVIESVENFAKILENLEALKEDMDGGDT